MLTRRRVEVAGRKQLSRLDTNTLFKLHNLTILSLIWTVRWSKNHEELNRLIPNFVFSAPIDHINKYNIIRAVVQIFSTQPNQTHQIYTKTIPNIHERPFYFRRYLEYQWHLYNFLTKNNYKTDYDAPYILTDSRRKAKSFNAISNITKPSVNLRKSSKWNFIFTSKYEKIILKLDNTTTKLEHQTIFSLDYPETPESEKTKKGNSFIISHSRNGSPRNQSERFNINMISFTWRHTKNQINHIQYSIQ